MRPTAARAILALTCIMFSEAGHAQTCGFREAFSRPDERGTTRIRVYQGPADQALGGHRPLLFVSSLKVNTDGTRISYHRDDPRAVRLAINDVRNAMPRGRTIAEFERVAAANWPLPRTWQVLSPSVIERNSRTGKPCVDSQGYLISMTSDVSVAGGFNRVGDCDASKWIDALTVPALVLPKGQTEFRARGATVRTPVVAMALGAGPARIAYGLVGDHGPENELGEASVAMNRILNGLGPSDNPRNYRDAINRFQAPRSAILLFPGLANRLARPLAASSVHNRSKSMFERWGGEQKLRLCLRELGAG